MLLPRALFIARNCIQLTPPFVCGFRWVYCRHWPPRPGAVHAIANRRPDRQRNEGRAALSAAGEFAAKARIGSMEEYEKLYRQAAADLEGFWGSLACELHWFEPFKKVLEWNEPFANWFVGGKTNAAYNCLDVHLATRRRNKAASYGRASRATRGRHLPDVARRGLPLRQRAEATRHRPRRRGFDLHAAGPRTGHCHAGLRGSARSIA